MIIIGLSRYSDNDIKQLLELKPDGVVLGDLFCNKKMFPYCGKELNNLMAQFKDRNISVIYQTPMYATDRVFDDIIENINYFYHNDYINSVIVQDIGLASYIKKACSNLTIIWGRMGYARTPIVNENTLCFYMKHGVDAFECKNDEQAEYVIKLGAIPYLVYGFPIYNTINRECYYKFENNIFDDDCRLGCLDKDKMLIPTNPELYTTIDGFVLGWKYYYDEHFQDYCSKHKNIIVYGDSLQVITSKIQEIKSVLH